MPLISWFVLANAILAAMLAEPAHAQDSAVYIATYIGVMPKAADSSAALLERYRDASRREDGNLRFDTLHEIARSNRFAILEAWKDGSALEAHDKASSTADLRARLKEILSAPPDERINSMTYGGPVKHQDRAGSLFVLTHVDVMPAHKDDCLALLKAMSIDISKDYGEIAYQVLQQETAETVLPSSKNGRVGRPSMPIPWRRTRANFARICRRCWERSTTSVSTTRSSGRPDSPSDHPELHCPGEVRQPKCQP